MFDFLRPAQRAPRPARDATVSSSSGKRTLVVPVDESQHSLRALEWLVRNLYRRGDCVHLVSVVPREAGPFPAEVLDAEMPAADTAHIRAWRREQLAHESETEALLSFMQHTAVNLGVKHGAVRIAALTALGGASGVGKSIASYVQDADADLLVLGSRGLHGWQRHVQNLLGLGSVSFYCLLQAPCPVVVVKQDAPSAD